VIFFKSTIYSITLVKFAKFLKPDFFLELIVGFIALGILVVLFGFFIDWIERKKILLPRFLGWGLIFFSFVFLFSMPVTGIWLLFIPAIGIIRRS
jgi:hypothetical protein